MILHRLAAPLLAVSLHMAPTPMPVHHVRTVSASSPRRRPTVRRTVAYGTASRLPLSPWLPSPGMPGRRTPARPSAVSRTTSPARAPASRPDPVTPAQRLAWDRVNRCENGGSWVPRGPAYPDGLGISAANWAAYAPKVGAPLDPYEATPDEQLMVAQAIEGGSYVPDQSGTCEAW